MQQQIIKVLAYCQSNPALVFMTFNGTDFFNIISWCVHHAFLRLIMNSISAGKQLDSKFMKVLRSRLSSIFPNTFQKAYSEIEIRLDEPKIHVSTFDHSTDYKVKVHIIISFILKLSCIITSNYYIIIRTFE